MPKRKIKSDQVFNKQYKILNPAQKKAVDTIEGPVVVIAGPGTGKSTVLTLRIANILRKTDTAPENILALTFTESGALVMRRKLSQIIGSAAYKVNIHTFHGFAESIIRQYPDYFPRIIGSKIITDAEQIKIIERLVQAEDIKVLRPYGDPNYYVKPILNEIHLLKRESVLPQNLIESIKKCGAGGYVLLKNGKDPKETKMDLLKKRDEKNMELAIVFERYEQELAKKKYYDFDDMLLELIRAIENDRIFKLILQETYQYILADEHQDANASQNKILELLADFHESPNLFIVGDDKQAIYRFQGASLENFIYFRNKYKGTKIVELDRNYRSDQGILDASHNLMEYNPSIPGRKRKRLISSRTGAGTIVVNEFDNKNIEVQHLASMIADLIKKGQKPNEIAVLYRENKEAFDISKALRDRCIIHRVESNYNVLDGVDSSKIILLCRAIYDLSDSEVLGKAFLLRELGCDPATVSELFNYAKRQRLPFFRIIEKLSQKERIDPVEILDSGKSEEIVATYQRFIGWSKESQHISFPVFLQKLIQETNLIAPIISAPDSIERLSSLESLFDRIVRVASSKNTFLLSDFIEYIDIIKDYGIMVEPSHNEYVNGVRLMTAHRAKGLEFDHVFIFNATDGMWGNRNKRNLFSIPIIEHARDTGRIEDERRLFYVALTRARKSVQISYSRFVDEKETIYSQFLAEIDPSFIYFVRPVIVISQESAIKRFNNHKVFSGSTILNPEYIRSKFLSQPFSVTHLNNFLQCPWRYFFVNLIRVPQVQSKHQIYGTAIHSALRSFFEAYKNERDLSKKGLIGLFTHNLEGQPLPVDDKKDLLRKGKESLSGYYDEYGGSWNRNILTEYGIKISDFHIAKDLPLILTGKLDKIELLDGKNVAVIDYKTSKPKSRNEIEGKTKSADGNYKRQLVFYQLLLDYDKKFKMNYGVIDFIEPNERGKFKREQFVVTKEEVFGLEELIRQTAQSIVDLSFNKKTCDDKDCEYCSLAKMIGNGRSSNSI